MNDLLKSFSLLMGLGIVLGVVACNPSESENEDSDELAELEDQEKPSYDDFVSIPGDYKLLFEGDSSYEDNIQQDGKYVVINKDTTKYSFIGTLGDSTIYLRIKDEELPKQTCSEFLEDQALVNRNVEVDSLSEWLIKQTLEMAVDSTAKYLVSPIAYGPFPVYFETQNSIDSVVPSLEIQEILNSDSLQGVDPFINGGLFSENAKPIYFSDFYLSCKNMNLSIVDEQLESVFGDGFYMGAGEEYYASITISHPVFNRDKSEALVSMSFYCGALCGSGFLAYFYLEDGEWVRSERRWNDWIS